MVVARKVKAFIAAFAFGALLIGCSDSHRPASKADDAPIGAMARPNVTSPPRGQPEPGSRAGAGAADRDAPAKPDERDEPAQPRVPDEVPDEPSVMEPTPTQPPPANTAPEPMPQPRGDCLLPGDGSYAEYGPYRVETMTVTTGSLNHEYTIFYPQPFETGCKHPIAVWGNATAVGGAENYGFLNANAASWGVVVAAAHTPNAFDPTPFVVGLEWLLAENENPDSIFYGKLGAKAGVAGHEQAGIGASSASHPNIAAVVAVMANANPNLGADVAYACLTGTQDVLSVRTCTTAYETAAGPAFLASWEGADMFTPTSQRYQSRNPGTLAVQRLYAAWLRCFLADDEAACKLFRGEPCGMCGEEGWAQLEGRNL